MILDHDLEMLAAVDRIDRTAGHAMRVGARAARCRDEIIAEAPPIAQQSRDRQAVRIVAVLLGCSPRAFVAARAEIHVEHEDALALVEALLDVLATIGSTSVSLRKSRERLLDEAPAHDREPAQHLEEIGASETGELEVIQRRAGRASHSGRDHVSGFRRRCSSAAASARIDCSSGSCWRRAPTVPADPISPKIVPGPRLMTRTSSLSR